MPTRQYIGARYVPKFYNNEIDTPDWRPNVIYEPLTIVTYLSNSYTSKKEVPANIGAPDVNPEYWAATGNYNAQVEEYRQEVLEVIGIVDQMHTLKDRKFIFIGDSYGAGQSSVEPYEQDSYYDYFVQYNDIESASYHKHAVSAYGFNKPDHLFKTLLQEVAATLTADEKLEITDVICCGGANDGAYRTGLKAAVVDFCTYAKTTFPNAKISIGMIAYSPTSSSNNMIWNDVMKNYVKGAAESGAVYLSGIENALHEDIQFLSDGHPNEDGQKILGVALTNAIRGGYATILDNMYLLNQITLVSSLDSGQSTFQWFYTQQHDGVVEFSHVDFDAFVFNTPLSLTNKLTTDWIPIGTLKNTHMTGAHHTITQFPVTVRAWTSSGVFGVQGIVNVTNGNLNLKVIFPARVTESYIGFDIAPFHATFDARNC